jgi:hypothetical protein
MDAKQEMASIVKDLIEELLSAPITITTLNSNQATGAVDGRFRSGALVYDYRIKGDNVSYKPITNR